MDRKVKIISRCSGRVVEIFYRLKKFMQNDPGVDGQNLSSSEDYL